jgi:parvulin-like peptidyl-prolyl isomerase
MDSASRQALTREQEAEAQLLAERIRQATAEDFLQLARLLVGTKTKDLFGQTEFRVRDILLQAGAKIYSEYLAEKKTVTKDAV